MRHTLTHHGAKAFAAIAMLALAGCSTPSSKPPAASAAEARDVSELNIGYFAVTNANPYAQALNQAVLSTAEEAGAKVTMIDSNFDAQTQINQMQQAMARDTYNAWIVVAADGVQECNQIKSAIDSGIPVMISTGHVCGDANIGQVGFVGVQGAQAYADWWKVILEANPNGHIAFFAGPPLVDLVKTMKVQMDGVLAKYPDAKLVSYQNTEWTPEDTFQKTQDLLQAHPDVTVIATSCGCNTQGVVQALKQAGRDGEVQVYDMMGGQAVVDQIAEGSVTLSLPGLPASEGRSAVENLVNFWTGEKTYDVFNPADDSPVPDGPYVTKDNASGYHAETP